VPEPETIRRYDAGHALDRQAMIDGHAWLNAQLGPDVLKQL
jgi:hypothetical protein